MQVDPSGISGEAAAIPDGMPGAARIGQRCLVTGGAGYVGRALVARLRAAGCSVRSFDVLPQAHEAGVDSVVGDLRDAAALRAACAGIDTVFHTAALINTLSRYRPAERAQVFGVNVDGTRQLLAAAAEAGVAALVHISSFNVALSAAAGTAPQDESAPYVVGARDLYTASKIEAERAALAADRPAGLRVCALRPGGIWGSDTGSVMIRSFLEQLAAGKFKVLVGDPCAVTDNTHVDNLVDAGLLAAAALREWPQTAGGRAYNISDGEPMNGMAWFRPLVEGLGYAWPRRWLPMSLIRGVARGAELAHWLGAPMPLLTLRGVNNLAESSRLSIERARRELGYAPRLGHAEGLARLLPAARAFVAARRTAG
jgi:3beta-hydroxy-delta5-steroid dehydrogenase/steroid delta-isomerase